MTKAELSTTESQLSDRTTSLHVAEQELSKQTGQIADLQKQLELHEGRVAEAKAKADAADEKMQAADAKAVALSDSLESAKADHAQAVKDLHQQHANGLQVSGRKLVHHHVLMLTASLNYHTCAAIAQHVQVMLQKIF